MSAGDGEASLFTAGQLVPPGTYVRVDAWSGRRVVLTENGRLPASFDGQVAVYRLAAPVLAAGHAAATGCRDGSARPPTSAAER